MKTNRSPVSAVSSQPERFSLRNDYGFWELAFNGRHAVVPQHQALFYVAWLLSNPPTRSIPAPNLAASVFQAFALHQDFRLSIPLLRRHDDAAVLNLLRKKQHTLESILDSLDELEPAHAEVQGELNVLSDLELTYTAQIAATHQQTSDALSRGLIHLHNTLATAVDCQGAPHQVLRLFARHLLLYLLIPSSRASAPGAIARFTYQPPPGLVWSANP